MTKNFCFFTLLSMVILSGCNIFSDNEKTGVYVDKKTNLTWMKCILGYKWNGTGCIGEEKSYYPDDFNKILKEVGSYAGHSDWRIPTIHELNSIVSCPAERSYLIWSGFTHKFGECTGGGDAFIAFLKSPYKSTTRLLSSNAAKNPNAKYGRNCMLLNAMIDCHGNLWSGSVLLVRTTNPNEQVNVSNVFSLRKSDKKGYNAQRRYNSKSSGNFKMFANMPEDKNSYYYYGASCDEGGSAFVNIQKDSPNVFCWGGKYSGCEVGIGVEAAMRKGCGGN